MRDCYVCVGNYADNPYLFQKLGIRVYCMEELCYILEKNAYLLDRSIVNRDLVTWIEKECELPELAGELSRMVSHQVSESAFVETILQYVCFQSPERIKEIVKVLSEGASLDVFEKRKVRADFFLKNGSVQHALSEYERLLEEIPYQNGTITDRENLAKVYHNMGVLLTQLFLFEEAAASFLRSYEIAGNEESYVEYLLALRMYVPQEEYLRFIAEHEEAYAYSLLAEKRIGEVENAWRQSKEFDVIARLREIRDREGNLAFAGEVAKVTHRLKDRYRSLMRS